MKNIFIFILGALLILPFSATADKTSTIHVTHNKFFQRKEKPQRKKIDVWYRGEVDLGLGVGSDSGPIIELQTIHGIHITKYAFLGIGAGMHCHTNLDQLFAFPIFGNMKFYYPINEKFAPFLNIEVGVDASCGGAYFGTGVGLKYKRWQFGVGVRLQDIIDDNYSYNDNWYYSEDDGIKIDCYLKVGFTFGGYKKH